MSPWNPKNHYSEIKMNSHRVSPNDNLKFQKEENNMNKISESSREENFDRNNQKIQMKDACDKNDKIQHPSIEQHTINKNTIPPNFIFNNDGKFITFNSKLANNTENISRKKTKRVFEGIPDKPSFQFFTAIYNTISSSKHNNIFSTRVTRKFKRNNDVNCMIQKKNDTKAIKSMEDFISSINVLEPKPITDQQMLKEIFLSKPINCFINELFNELERKNNKYTNNIVEPKDFTFITMKRKERLIARLFGEYCPVRMRIYQLKDYNSSKYKIYRENLFTQSFKHYQLMKNTRHTNYWKMKLEFFGWNKEWDTVLQSQCKSKRYRNYLSLKAKIRYSKNWRYHCSKNKKLILIKRNFKRKFGFIIDTIIDERKNCIENYISNKRYFKGIQRATRKHLVRRWKNHEQEYKMICDLLNDTRQEKLNSI